jgi:hypothetical protein
MKTKRRQRLQRIRASTRRFLKIAVQKGAGFAREHPIKSASIGLTAALTIVVAVSFVFTNDIFVDDVVITEGVAAKVAYNGVIVTQTALAGMKAVAEERANKSLLHETKFLDVIERKSERFATERLCNTTMSVETSFALFTSGIQRATMSSSSFGEVLTGRSGGIRRFAFSIREKLGHPVRELRLFLGPRDQRYEARIEPYPPVIPAFRKYVDSLDRESVSLAFTELLLDALSPEVMAVEGLAVGTKDFSRSRKIARDFLQDEQKELLVHYIELASRLEMSRTVADQLFSYQELATENAKLLQKVDFGRYGEAGLGMKLAIIGRLLLSEPNSEDAYNKYILPITSDLGASFVGTVWLASYDIAFGKLSESDALLDKIFSYDVRRETGGRADEHRMYFYFAALLVEVRQWDRVSKLLSKFKLDGDGNVDMEPRTLTELRTLNAIADLNLGKSATYEKLAAAEFYGHYCAEYVAISKVRDWVEAAAASDSATATRLIHLMTEGLDRIAANGLRSFEFFNFRGVMEDKAEHPAAAQENYQRALQYDGDHSWALLNWGRSLLLESKASEAAAKYRESLTHIILPAAVDGLLRSLYAQDDEDEFLRVFNNRKYADPVAAMPLKNRSSLQAAATIFSCRTNKPLQLSMLKPDELMFHNNKPQKRSDFDAKTCKFAD